MDFADSMCDLEQTQAIFLEDYDDDTDEDIEKEKKIVSLLKNHFSFTLINQYMCCETPFLCRLRSIPAHRDHFVRHLSVRLSGSHTFLVVKHSYVS